MAGSMRPLQPAQDGRPRWELRVAGGWDPQRLRYRQVSRTIVGSRREASSALARLATEVDDGKHLGGDATVAELFTHWLALIEDHRSPTTLREYHNKDPPPPKPGPRPRPGVEADQRPDRRSLHGVAKAQRLVGLVDPPGPRRAAKGARTGPQVGLARAQPGDAGVTTVGAPQANRRPVAG